MFTLHFPIQLPPEHTFLDTGQYPIPPLPGGLSVRSINNAHAPLVLQVSGFAAEQDAIDFCPLLATLIRGAALEMKHSMSPSDAPAVVSDLALFNGNVPTVTPTRIGATPCHASVSQQEELHISVLSKVMGDCMTRELPAKLNATPKHRIALELFSECEFAGGTNAQFVMLLTALEVLVPGSKGKRGAVVKFVKTALGTSGHADPKSAGNDLDGLYVARNSLIHAAKPVTHSQLIALKEIVRITLKALTL